MNAGLRLLLGLVLLAPVVARAQAPSGREQLRTALRDYYAHLLAERLELSPSQGEALRARIDELVTAQHEGQAAARQARRRLDAALRAGAAGAEELAPLVRETLATERAALERTAASRRGLVEGLEPRQQATFLLFEDEFRAEVVQRLRSLRPRDGQQRRPGPGPWRRGGDETGGASADGAREAAAEAPSPEREERRVEDLTLLLALQARRQVGLDTTALLDLLPELEAAVRAQVALARLEREARSELRAALDADARRGELKRLAAKLLEQQGQQRIRLLEAHEAIIARLEPAAGARFLLLQERFRSEAPRRLRLLERLGDFEERWPERRR